jgi:hypothetical protein
LRLCRIVRKKRNGMGCVLFPGLVLTATLLIGIAFIGLAYHHARRHHERLRLQEAAKA